ncbi:hypothetical protein HZS_4619 [Henneguya salminicola]|nr:hypothetical protein HZS_4619 [Henneguya salminicola]
MEKIIIVEEFVEEDMDVKNSQDTSDVIVEVKNITVVILVSLSMKTRDGNRNIFENLNVKLLYNKIYILLGENGSGKSIFIQPILGMIKPTKSKINLYKPQIDRKIIEHIFFIGELK